MRLFLLSICFLIFINCQESEIRRPVNKNKKLFLKESAIRNKNRFEIEQELFKKFAENSMLEFSISEFGFWYAHKTGRKINGPIPKKGDQVSFSYKIEDLNNNLLYSEKELGKVSFLIDEEGTVRHAVINDLPLGRNIDEMLRMIDALSHHQKHGEVCPAGWKD